MHLHINISGQLIYVIHIIDNQIKIMTTRSSK